MKRIPEKRDLPTAVQKILVLILLIWFAIFLIMPMVMMFGQVFYDDMGVFVGLGNFRDYFANPLLTVSIRHSLAISLETAVLSTLLGFLYAYGITRTGLRGKTFFRYASLLPLFIPTMVHGMALIYIFGRTGFITKIIGLDIGLYGRTGIVLAELVYTFPQTVMVLMVALNNADNRLYEAARVMDISPVRTFFRVTLPSVRYGLINSFIISFTLCFTDFGAPEVVGGNYSVLATDIYREVVGQQKMSMGAVVGVVLTIPVFLSFIIDTALKKKNAQNELSSRAVAFKIQKSRGRDTFFQVFCSLIVVCIFALIASVLMSAIVTRWPNDLSLTLEHFNFGKKLIGSGAVSFKNSLLLSLLTALLGTLLVFSAAYLIEKGKVWRKLCGLCRFLANVPMALPGLVLGLGYIMYFNKSWINLSLLGISVSNPFYSLYGTFGIMVFCMVIHLFSVCYVTASTALKKLDREYENVAESMSVPFWKVFFRVTLPMSLNAVFEVFIYFFVNTMVSVSAIVFLYTTANKPAAIAILNMDDNGDYASAAAMSILILLINIVIRAIYEVLNKRLSKRIDRWKNA